MQVKCLVKFWLADELDLYLPNYLTSGWTLEAMTVHREFESDKDVYTLVLKWVSHA